MKQVWEEYVNYKILGSQSPLDSENQLAKARIGILLRTTSPGDGIDQNRMS